MSKAKMKKIGLTGVMGAGKSSVIQILKKRHITILDCDEINFNLQRKSQAGYQGLLQMFGNCILDVNGELDRKQLSDLIFQNESNRKQVEALLHPLIQQEIIRECKLHQQERMIVVEVPLLFESQWEAFFDECWVIACEESILLQRLMTKRHVSYAEAKRRLAVQMSQDEKINKADVVIWNNGDLTALEKQIDDIIYN